MSAPSTSGLLVELPLRVIDVKYGCFTFTFNFYRVQIFIHNKQTKQNYCYHKFNDYLLFFFVKLFFLSVSEIAEALQSVFFLPFLYKARQFQDHEQCI